MDDIYDTLARHFSHNATPEEEHIVAEFKKENLSEYDALKKLWEANLNAINLIDFDTKKALKKIEKQVNQKRKNIVVSLFSSARGIAAAVILLVVALFLSYRWYDQENTSPLITVNNKAMNSSSRKLSLEDGSVIWLNKGGTISYPTSFSKNKREVTLKGEAFFEVAKDASRPFIVHTKHSQVKVLGTSFNIAAHEKNAKITVRTGKVKVQLSRHKKSVTLTPGYAATASAAELIKFSNNDKNYLAWKTGIFEFENTPLEKVIASLETFYQTSFIIKDQGVVCDLTAKLDNKKIQDVIKILKLACKLQINKKNNEYIIKLK